VFIVSKKPIIIWQGSHLSFRKFKIIAKIFILSFDIQRSNNNIVQEWHDLKIHTINMSLVCSTALNKISFTKAHLDGKTRQGFYLITSFLKNETSTKDKGTNSLVMNKATKSSPNCFWLGLSLL
jgi:hypothetical protein